MSITSRYFLYEESGELKRLAKELANDLSSHRQRLPQYADQRLKSLTVYVDTEDGKLTRIDSASGEYLEFDDTGELIFNWSGPTILPIEQSSEDNVVSIEDQLNRDKYHRENHWEPTSEQLDEIAAILWPDPENPVKVDYLKGTGRKSKFRATHRGNWMVDDASPVLFDLTLRIERLSARDLQGVMARIDQTGLVTNASPSGRLWNGVRDAAEVQLAIQKARASNKGKWIAEVTVYRDDQHEKHVAHVWHTEQAMFDGRKAAEEAAQQFLIDNAKWFDLSTRVEVQIFPEIEYMAREAELS